jgi:DNA-binding transcriptional MerR regulator
MMFVTLPIGKVGITSRNGNTYGRPAIEQLVQQVNSKRVEGRWGHLSADEIGTRYEPPAVRWLAAVLDANGVAWGKAVPLTREAVRHFEMADATGARVGTSIFGLEPRKGEAGEIESYRLVTIDLANAERVGVPLTAAQPHITTEMATTPSRIPEASTEEVSVATETRIEELTADRARLQEQVTGLERQLQEVRTAGTVLAEVRKVLDLDESADVAKTLRERQAQMKELADENAALLESAMTAEIAGKVKLESARPIVRKLVEAQKPRTRKALSEALDTTLADDAIKALLAQQVKEQAGPPQSRPTSAPGSTWEQYVEIPKEEA